MYGEVTGGEKRINSLGRLERLLPPQSPPTATSSSLTSHSSPTSLFLPISQSPITRCPNQTKSLLSIVVT
jgi:hypothetical protein